jgi:raffinose/stachyose/melibiose transport system substrate-binding protein
MNGHRPKLSRRQLLKVMGTSAVGVGLAACVPTTAPPASEQPAVGKQAQEIQFDAGGYTPSQYIGRNLQEGEPERQAFDIVAAAYREAHPDVQITFLPYPMGDRRETMITMLTGGTAPDLMWTQPDWVNEDLGKEWWLNLDPYLDLPNPYVKGDNPGSGSWHDSFYPSVDFWRAPDGHLYMLLGDQTQVGIYYNKDLFKEAGIAEIPPSNWEGLMAYGEALKAVEKPGFAWCGGGRGVLDQLTWVSGWLAKYFFWDYMSTYDTDDSGWADKWEIAQAIKDGTYSAQMTEQVERLRTMKRMATYWQEGALGMDWEATHRLFLSGGAGMEVTGVWMLQNFLNDPERKFELGWFYFPTVDKLTSNAVPDDVPLTSVASGYGSFQYALTAMAKNRGTNDVAADFLMFATTPENIGLLVNEVPSTIPNVKGAALHPLTEEMGFADSITYPPSSFQEDDSLLDFEYGMNFASVVAPYCVEQLGEADMLNQLQGYMDVAAERVLAIKAKQSG